MAEKRLLDRFFKKEYLDKYTFYKVESVVDFREKRRILNISDYGGEAYVVTENNLYSEQSETRAIKNHVEKYLVDQNHTLVVSSKDYVRNDTLMYKLTEKHEWSSWFMVSQDKLERSIRNYIFVIVSEKKNYFILFSEEGMKKLVKDKKIASNDRYHFYFGVVKKWREYF